MFDSNRCHIPEFSVSCPSLDKVRKLVKPSDVLVMRPFSKSDAITDCVLVMSSPKIVAMSRGVIFSLLKSFRTACSFLIVSFLDSTVLLNIKPLFVLYKNFSNKSPGLTLLRIAKWHRAPLINNLDRILKSAHSIISMMGVLLA